MATPFSAEAKQEPGVSGKVLLIAALAVALVAGIAALATLHRAPSHSAGPDSYAANLSVSNLTLSEATNGAGGKVTYVDGVLKNNGPQTLRAATVEVRFGTDDGTPAQAQTAPITLVRTREPYVDLEPISAEPLPPGGSHDFRLIFESVPASWNQKEPAIRVVTTAVQ